MTRLRENASNLATSCGRAPTLLAQSSRCQGSTYTPNARAGGRSRTGAPAWAVGARTRSAGTLSTARIAIVVALVSRFSARRLIAHIPNVRGRARGPALMKHRRERQDPQRDHDERQL